MRVLRFVITIIQELMGLEKGIQINRYKLEVFSASESAIQSQEYDKSALSAGVAETIFTNLLDLLELMFT